MAWLWPLLAAPFAGSFLGVLIRRLPRGHLLQPARSCCEACGARIALGDLVPLLSAAVLRGRCRVCRTPFPREVWLIELAAVAVAGTAVLAGMDADWFWPGCVFGWAMLALAWIDWDWMLLPDVITLPLIPAGLFVTLWLAPDDATEHAAAAAAGYCVFWLVNAVYRRLRGREGIGEGDAKLLAAIGAWTGLGSLGPVVLGAALVGLAGGVALMLRGRMISAVTPVPFGCCLALAGWVALLAQHAG